MSADLISNDILPSDHAGIETALSWRRSGFEATHSLPPLLDPDAVYLWWINLDWNEHEIATAFSELAVDERQRANRYRRPLDRIRFVTARTCLRRVLGSILDIAPGRVSFERGEHGKPRLAAEFELYDVRFNLAHSEHLAVLAITSGREIGVDLESVRSNICPLDIASQFFTAEEHQALEALAPNDRLKAFYRCWTRKEAYAKALGAGLSLPLNSFSVSVSAATEDIPIVSSTSLQSRACACCKLIDISPDPSFAATVAIVDRQENRQTASVQLHHISNYRDFTVPGKFSVPVGCC
jgi:4'-phosphopantetheinyl transferase